MSDAAIRAALEAACQWMHENCGDAESIEAWRPDAAGTIAAFLRALPRTYVEASQDGGYVAISAHSIAAAVERAAGGEG